MRRFQKLVLAAVFRILLFVCSVTFAFAQSEAPAVQRFTTGTLPPPRFADPERASKLAAAFPEIERLFVTWVEQRHMPGAVVGVLIDGELAWLKTAGVRERDGSTPVTADTVFRIASMTKSFTAMAILKLRDEGRLSLEEPVARYVPAVAQMPYPTKDSPPLTVRHLLTHSEGFPEDNPWGDQQLARSEETMSAWIRAGIPFSNVPGVAYEYSNYGFAILGEVVAKASGERYEDYVRKRILEPLGMSASGFEVAKVPAERRALGYRWEDNIWKSEPALEHGAFGAMGGLWTSARDLARYVGFHLSAFPPRDDAEKGPLKRSSLREMQQAARSQPASALRRTVDAPLELNASAYGYGLGVSQSCRFGHSVAHGGGLPGYGSLMRWLPEYGVGLIAMGNVTYASFGEFFNNALDALYKTQALQPRVVTPSPALLAAQKEVSQLVVKWDDAAAEQIAADNLFLDQSAERRAASLRELAAKHGLCRPATTIDAENALRGSWRMPCEKGWLEVRITLAPTMPPRVQYLNVQGVSPPIADIGVMLNKILQLLAKWDGEKAKSIVAPGFDIQHLKRTLSAAAPWGTCKLGDAVAGDGSRESAVKLECDRGIMTAQVSLEASSHRLKNLDLAPARGQRCVP